MREEILDSLRREYAIGDLVGENPAFRTLVENLKRVADKDVSVLLVGETGTGKGRCIEFMHQCGDLSDKPLIPFNCGACPDSLFESQIFGHVRGAFTGADKDQIGLLEEADSGLLFLDEVNSLNIASQVKLNQFLDSGHFRRVGDTKLRRANVRIVAATNCDLRQASEHGEFRQDLYYRLAEYELCVPPLRCRGEDILALARYFLKNNVHLSRFEAIEFSEVTIRALLIYAWPGNVRELESFVKCCIINAESPRICVDRVRSGETLAARVENEYLNSLPWKEAKKRVVRAFEKAYVSDLLSKHNGIVVRCARHAHMHPPDFWKLIRKHDLHAAEFKESHQSSATPRLH